MGNQIDEAVSPIYFLIKKEIEELYKFYSRPDVFRELLTDLDSESTSKGVFVTDPSGNIKWINHAFTKITGYSFNEMVGKGVSFFKDDIIEMLQKKGNWQGELKSYRKTGEKCVLYMTICPVKDEQESWTHSIGIFVDLTKLKYIENSLRIAYQVFDDSSDGMVITNRKGTILAVNSSFSAVTGYNPEEVIGKKPNILSSGMQDLNFYKNMWGTLLSTGKWEGEIWNRRKDGEIYPEWLKIISVKNNSEEAINFVGIFSDITERKKTEDEQKRAERVLQNTGEGIIVTDTNGIILSVNPAFTDVTGYNADEAIGKKTSMLQSGRHDHEFYTKMWQVLKQNGKWQGEIWNRRKNGEIFPEWLSINTVKDDTGKSIHYVAVISDISPRKKMEERLKYMAYYDSLTGLPNRLLFQNRLKKALITARRYKQKVAVLFLDLDRFKNINDTLGHSLGDMLLQDAAQRLKECVKRRDTVARLGGDEFIILLHEFQDVQEVISIAQKILNLMAEPFHIHGKELYITTSIGISLYPFDGDDSETLVKNADTAMYQAKEEGNNYRLYTFDMNAKVTRKMELENGLRKAIERDEIIIYYQPQMDIHSKTIIGLEALARWNHPEMGMVSPAEFIPLAEETGLIIPLNEWILRMACKQNKAWQANGFPHIPIGVNLASQQFQKNKLVTSVDQILKETGLQPKYLDLEITERVAMLNTENTIYAMKELKNLGVTISIDDFGTGYSSLSYLKHFPIDTLKIDQSFIREISINSTDAAIVKAIITLAHGLNLKVIAEGVETIEQLELLKHFYCNGAQGFFFKKPLPASEIELLFAKSGPAIQS